ncbi:potassium transporter [Rhodoblastus acidophilus]|uniref:Potassium transporter n=1 Tax=Rhodoblastus acidophilus TaxID=1074 RepID=A0A6N8DJQ4_RHOAC|nr:ion channel [Rhodoblastus acidophilus]MCW2273376.1 inward rectifier potassium channel [Rhodoblastus acidophilus]MTV30538.1 potassium transporter [Rhodoblastus acidophilus]
MIAHPDKARKIRVADREFLARGLKPSLFGDLFHNSMRLSWPAFFAGFAVYFLTMNLLFASLFHLGGDCIANARPGSFLDKFFFSVETLATVGYGDMHPANAYAHLVVTAEIFTGLSTLAVFTGLIFARFSRPRARVIFAEALVIGPHQGETTLMARLANARHSVVTEAEADLWLIYAETTLEGRRFVRFRPLPLAHRRNPIFVLSWTLFHTIDESSPLHGLTRDDLKAMDARILLVFNGHDEASGQTLVVRRGYHFDELRFNHVYADIGAQPTEEGALQEIDYRKIHQTEAVD